MVEIDAVLFLPDTDERRADVPERVMAPVYDGSSISDDVAGIEQHARDEIQSLLRSGRDDDPLGVET